MSPLGLLLLVLAAGMSVHHWSHCAMAEDLRADMFRASSTVAALFGSQALSVLGSDAPADETAVAAAFDALRRLQAADDRLAAIQIGVPRGGTIRWLLDTASSGTPGAAVPDSGAAQATLRDGQPRVDGPDVGPCTAFAPIHHDGAVVACVAVELRPEWTSRRLSPLRNLASAAVGLAMLPVLAFGWAIWRMRKQAREARVRLDESVAELARARDEAQAAAAAKSTFLATMSHELRTPMNGVVGMLELLGSTSVSPQQAEYLETARRSAQGLLGVLNDILDLSKIEAGRLVVHKEEFDLDAVVGEVTDMLAEMARKKGIELVSGVRPLPFPRVLGDGQRVRQVLVNLVGNAVKFTSKGFVAVRMRAVDGADATTKVRCEVQDTGPGIAKDETDKLFRSFSQLDGSHRRVHGGTGLGLAISRRLVELMGGTIGVDSAPGRGSTFWFELPLQRAGKASVRVPDRRSIVLVGPTCLGQRQLVADLKALGFTASVQADVATAGAELRRRADPRGVLIVDARALGGDDAELVDVLRSDGQVHGAGAAARSCELIVMVGDGRRIRLEGLQELGLPVLWYLWPFPLSRFLRELEVRSRGSLAGPTPARANGPVLGLKVLVAEDNEVNQRVTQAMLKKLGCEAVVVPDGVMAVAQAERGQFDCILMDCMMPRMDGYQATAAIRERESDARRMPILALTANAMVGDKERCLQAGMDLVLTKPVVLQDLASALTDVKRGKDLRS